MQKQKNHGLKQKNHITKNKKLFKPYLVSNCAKLDCLVLTRVYNIHKKKLDV